MGERDEKPLAGGVFRGKFARSAGPGAMFLVEEIFAPAKHDARMVQEEQKRLAEPVPAPTDPPDLVPEDDDPEQPFKGRITLRRPE